MSRVMPVWKGQTVVAMASGPSLAKEHCEMVRAAGLRTGVVNDCYLMASFADVAYFADMKWWNWHKDREEWKAFSGQKCTINASSFQVDDVNVHVLRNGGGEGLSTDPTAIFTGSHSGYQLLNILTLSGAALILMLGYDCRQVDGKKHWFGNHPDGTEPPYLAIKGRYNKMAQAAEAAGIRIINCTPGSAIDSFQRGDLASILADTRCAVVSA